MVIMFYLNEDTFLEGDSIKCIRVKGAIDEGIQVVLVHEKDIEGGPFSEIIVQTPQ